MPQYPARRPLASRNTGWAHALTRHAIRMGFSPNGISFLGMGLAACAGAAFWASGAGTGILHALLLLLGAACVQGRLLCNLLDGMVAIEGGMRSADGPFWNEFPDRISDALILLGLAAGIGMPMLGWAAVALAFLTAYLRELGVSNGFPADFSGPMAKPHRMAAVTFGALAAIPAGLFGAGAAVLKATLWVVMIGTALTVLRRSARLLDALHQRG